MARGGNRYGAGRKRNPNRKRQMTIRIKPTNIDWLRRQEEGISPTIDRLITAERLFIAED